MVTRKRDRTRKTAEVETAEEISPGVYEIRSEQTLIDLPAPHLMVNPADYLESIQMQVINRIVRLSENGKPDDNIKLKANLALLNKLMPDKLRHEFIAMDPYSKILEMIKTEEEGK